MYKCLIQDNFMNNTKNIIIIKEDSVYDFGKKKMVERELGCACSNKEILELPRAIYQAIAMEIQKDKSIPDREKQYFEGKQEATEKHLKDLQKIVFKKKWRK